MLRKPSHPLYPEIIEDPSPPFAPEPEHLRKTSQGGRRAVPLPYYGKLALLLSELAIRHMYREKACKCFFVTQEQTWRVRQAVCPSHILPRPPIPIDMIAWMVHVWMRMGDEKTSRGKG